jgi:fatty acid desaturase
LIGGAITSLSAWILQPGLPRLSLQIIGVSISGISLNVFFMLVHEGMHSVLFRNKYANYFGATLFAIPLFFSYTAFRVLHLRHHRFLGERLDPDEYKFYARSPFALWVLHYLRITIAPYLYIILIPILAMRYATMKERSLIVTEYFLLACFYIFIFHQISLLVLLMIWIIPACFTAYLIGLWGLTQHALTDAGDPLLASRSVLAHPIVAFCFINQNYHLEHHLFPEVPSYHLKDLHRLITHRLPHALRVRSYLSFLSQFILASVRQDEGFIGLIELTGWEI